VQIYTTANAEWRDTARYWTELYRRLSFPVTLRPLGDAAFSANLRLASIGQLEIGEFAATPSQFHRSNDDVAHTAEHSFFLRFEICGDTRLTHCGHTTELRPGDLVLLDSHAPSEVASRAPHRNISLRMTRDLLEPYIPFPEQLCGLRVDGGKGIVRLMRDLLPSVWVQAREGVPAEAHDLLVDSILSLLGACYAVDRPGVTGSANATKLRAQQIKQYIENHLGDPGLSPGTIAAAHDVSTRYLHRLFEQEGETVSQYMLRRRLNECAARLGNPLWRSMTVTQIAFTFGFSNLSHFSRAFRDRFGKTPTQHRDEQ
jgi:AraC-like DNA-binding protein